jgi:hypothetical protein
VAQTELKLNSAAFDACNRAVIISGCGRSGTTILGQVLHSMDGVEYCFEGPMLVSLFAAMPTLRSTEWMLLYETYLYEEFLINALSGRGLNCNRADDSSIYKAKDPAMVESRLSKSKGKTEAAAEARSSTIAYKVPDIAPFLKGVKSLYPGSRIVLLKRHAGDTINSILQKKWFSDEVLKAGLLLWPNRMRDDILVPHWIPEADIDYWIRSDELHRAAYYYAFMTEAGVGLQNAITVDYARMLQNPNAVIESLARELDLKFGSRTPAILSTIKKTASPTADVLSKLEPEMRQRLAALEAP